MCLPGIASCLPCGKFIQNILSTLLYLCVNVEKKEDNSVSKFHKSLTYFILTYFTLYYLLEYRLNNYQGPFFPKKGTLNLYHSLNGQILTQFCSRFICCHCGQRPDLRSFVAVRNLLQQQIHDSKKALELYVGQNPVP